MSGPTEKCGEQGDGGVASAAAAQTPAAAAAAASTFSAPAVAWRPALCRWCG